jgi:hypothetical protein
VITVPREESEMGEQSAHHVELGCISIVLIGILAVAGGIIWMKHGSLHP